MTLEVNNGNGDIEERRRDATDADNADDDGWIFWTKMKIVHHIIMRISTCTLYKKLKI